MFKNTKNSALHGNVKRLVGVPELRNLPYRESEFVKELTLTMTHQGKVAWGARSISV